MRVGLVVVAFDEVERIEATVRGLRDELRTAGHALRIVVAADGEDGTREVAGRLAADDPTITVVGGPARRGKGRSVREAMALCDGDVVGFVDGDGKTPPEHVVRVVEALAPHPLGGRSADVAIGSRRREGPRGRKGQVARTPQHRRVGSRLFAAVTHAIVGLGDIPDTQCGCKFFTAEAARTVFARQTVDGYLFDVELLATARSEGLRIAQVLVASLDDGDSRSRPVRDAAAHLATLVRLRRSFQRRVA